MNLQAERAWLKNPNYIYGLILLMPAVTLLAGFSLPFTRVKPDIFKIEYPEHLPGAFTGGFGEDTCRSCHFDYSLNPEGGRLTISGIEKKIKAGSRIEITITVKRENMGSAGFQLSARFPDGSQAGSFKIESNNRIMFTEAVPDSLQYVQHSKRGTEPVAANKNRWKIIWQAPDSARDKVIFNIAANAANGDRSRFGDFIYAREVKVELIDS